MTEIAANPPDAVLPSLPYDRKLSFDLGKVAFSLVPLSPETVGRRKTLLTEIVKDSIWTLDQIQGIVNVNGVVRDHFDSMIILIPYHYIFCLS